MNYLLDTNWIISFLKGRPDAVGLVTELLDHGLAMSVVSYGETCEGLLTEVLQRREPLDQLASLTDVLQVDLTIALRYATVRSYLRSRGKLIPDNDLWIAATALAHDLTLVTRDGHFERVPGLKLYQQVR